MAKGSLIKSRREMLGISQIELAEKIGTSKQNLYKYENDIITNIPSDIIEKLASALDCSPAYLMGWEDGWNEADPVENPAEFEAEWRRRGGAAHKLILTKEEEAFILEARTMKQLDENFYKRMMAYFKAMKEVEDANR